MNPVLVALGVAAVGALLWIFVYCLFHYSAKQASEEDIEEMDHA